MTLQVITRAEAVRIDQRAMERFGIPRLLLMEAAGRAVADAAARRLGRVKAPRVVVLCGRGHNGGDGFVAARHLLGRGATVRVALAGRVESLRDEPRLNAELLQRLGQAIAAVAGPEEVPPWGGERLTAHLIIDALLGIGATGAVREPERSLIAWANGSGVPILAVDIASGLDADTGEAMGVAIKAVETVTFTCAKHGHQRGRGPTFSGELTVADIGIPRALLDELR